MVKSNEKPCTHRELLSLDQILQYIDPPLRKQLRSLEIEASLDSTNSALQRLSTDAQHGAAILAEHQTAGRGRRGRKWHSPSGQNLYMSLGWRFEQSLSELGCLPLVVATSAAQALTRAGLSRHKIKWPNDLLLDGKKFCGCLVEVKGDTGGPCHAVIGIGVNISMPDLPTMTEIDQPWTDIAADLPGCSRNQLAGLLLEELLSQLPIFSAQGFTPFLEMWETMDGLRGREVKVMATNRTIKGTVSGINLQGELLLDTGHEILQLNSGEVSIRNSGT